MNIIWSPEAIEDLISLRAYIAAESPPERGGSCCASCMTSNTCCRTTRIWAVQAACPERASWSFRRRPISFPTACNGKPSRFCGFITAPGVGRRACSASDGLSCSPGLTAAKSGKGREVDPGFRFTQSGLRSLSPNSPVIPDYADAPSGLLAANPAPIPSRNDRVGFSKPL